MSPSRLSSSEPTTFDLYVPKQDRARETVRNLLDAAITEIMTLGASGLRHERVVRTACVSQGSLYHHFKSRDGLIDAALVDMFITATDSLRSEIIELIQFDGDKRVDRLVTTMLNDDPRHRARATALLESTVRSSITPMIARYQAQLDEAIVAVLSSVGDPATTADVALLAAIVQSCSLARAISPAESQISGVTHSPDQLRQPWSTMLSLHGETRATQP